MYFSLITPDMILKWSMIFIRCGSILFFLPIFGDEQVPARIRIFLSIGCAFLLYPVVPSSKILSSVTSLELMTMSLVLLKEIFVGFTIGFVARMLVDLVIMSSSMVGYQMGFGMANVLLPGSTDQTTAFTVLNKFLFLLIFLSLNLHHILLAALAESFNVVPIDVIAPNSGLGIELIHTTSDLFLICMQLAAPVLIGLLFTMAALGLMARVVPQLNVFTLSFPFSFFIGLMIYISTMALMPTWIENYGLEYLDKIRTMLSLLA